MTCPDALQAGWFIAAYLFGALSGVALLVAWAKHRS